VRPAEPHRGQPGLVEASRLNGEQADLDVDPGAAQNVGASAGGSVRIAYCGDNTAYPRSDERLGAGTGQTGVCAGLKSDQGGAATGKRAGFGECAYLGMRSAAVLMETLADDLSSGIENDTADNGVGTSGAESAGGELKRSVHARDLRRRGN
jgi:hypothetical protein